VRLTSLSESCVTDYKNIYEKSLGGLASFRKLSPQRCKTPLDETGLRDPGDEDICRSRRLLLRIETFSRYFLWRNLTM